MDSNSLKCNYPLRTGRWHHEPYSQNILRLKVASDWLSQEKLLTVFRTPPSHLQNILALNVSPPETLRAWHDNHLSEAYVDASELIKVRLVHSPLTLEAAPMGLLLKVCTNLPGCWKLMFTPSNSSYKRIYLIFIYVFMKIQPNQSKQSVKINNKSWSEAF